MENQCSKCDAWSPNSDAKSGECRRSFPRHIGSSGRAMWPITLYNEGCALALRAKEEKEDEAAAPQ